MQVRCCGNCKKGHFGKCLDSKCVADRYHNFIPASTSVEAMLRQEDDHKAEAFNRFLHAVNWLQNGC